MFDKKSLNIIDAINVPVIITGKTGGVILWNSAAGDFFEGDLRSGISINKLFPAIKADESDIKLAMNRKTSLDYYNTEVLVGGVAKNADVSVSSIDAENGEVLFLLTVKDISLYYGLMKSVSRFGAIFENSPSAVLITDGEGNIEFLNEHFQYLTGYTLGELAGRNVSEFKSQIKRMEGSSGISETLMRGDKWKGELMNLTKTGSTYWVIATISPVRNSHGIITNYISVQEDITYLKKIEEELKQSEEKFRVLFEVLPEGIVVTDLKGTVIQVNKTFLKLRGYEEIGFIIGENVFDLADEGLSGLLRGLFSLAEKDGSSGSENYVIKNQKDVYVDIRVALMTGDSGPIGFVVLIVDNTDRRKSELALRESEARNRALVEAVPDIMFRVNNEGVYLDKMLGNKINEVFPESIAVDTVRYISEAIRTREIQIYEYPVTVSGRSEFYESRFIAIEDDEVLVILRNVTERYMAIKQIEEARREAEFANRAKSEFLANMSHEIRTPLNSITGFIELLMRSRIDENQREYVEIIKQSASNLLGVINDILDFSKIESRKLEINTVEFNPYREIESVIRLFSVKAFEKGIRFYSFIDPRIPTAVISDPLRIKQVLSNLLSNAIKFTPEDGVVIVEIGLSRIRDGFCLISFSVSDTGIGIPERKQKQIFEAFTQGDSSITRRFGGTGLGLSISSNLVRLLGSEIVVESVMGAGSKFYFILETEVVDETSIADEIKGLPVNACVITNDPRSILSRMLVSCLDDFGCTVNISDVVSSDACAGSDIVFVSGYPFTGEGVPLEKLSSIGKTMIAVTDIITAERYSAEEKQVFNRFISHPVMPDIFRRILLELRESETDFSDSTARSENFSIKFSGKVLVGEDNSINQKLMMLLLKDYGLGVEIAGNGLSVFEKFKDEKYDLVLMDLNMPAADGLEATAFIRDYEKEKGLKPVPVIALTAKVLKGDREIIEASGMNGYLTKPVEMDKLEAVLAGYLPLVKTQGFKKGLASEKGIVYDVKKVAAELKIPVNVLQSIGRDFFDDASKTVEMIREAADTASWREIGRLSHRIKGASANLRFEKLAGLCSELEENAAVPEKNFDYNGIVDSIINELDHLKSYF